MSTDARQYPSSQENPVPTEPQRLAAPPEAADDDPAVVTLMTHRLVGIVPDATVAVALRLMVQAGVRHLPVMDGQHCGGLVLETDLAEALIELPAGSARPVGDLCRPAPALGPSDRRSDAARLMRASGTDAALVVDGTRLIGIVTATDIVRSLAAGHGTAAP